MGMGPPGLAPQRRCAIGGVPVQGRGTEPVVGHIYGGREFAAVVDWQLKRMFDGVAL